jgi:hypothetical protein
MPFSVTYSYPSLESPDGLVSASRARIFGPISATARLPLGAIASQLTTGELFQRTTSR